MCVEPGFDDREVVGEGAGVLETAVCVAEGEGAGGVEVVLWLEDADASVELGGDVYVLVIHGEDADKRGAVRTDLRDIAVGTVTVFLVAVAAMGGLSGEVDEEGGQDCYNIGYCDTKIRDAEEENGRVVQKDDEAD